MKHSATKLDGESYYQSGDNKGTMRLRNIQLCDFFEDNRDEDTHYIVPDQVFQAEFNILLQ